MHKLVKMFERETHESAITSVCGVKVFAGSYVLWLEEIAAKTLEAQPETAGLTLAGVAPTTEQSIKCPDCGGAIIEKVVTRKVCQTDNCIYNYRQG
jgi:hypothetical protein